VIGESGDKAHYDPALCDVVTQEARILGMQAESVIAPVTNTAADVPDDLRDKIAGTDHTVFFARMADQLRFLGVEGSRSMVSCYTLTPDVLADLFTSTDHRLLLAVHDRLVEHIEASAHYRITCPDGSDLHGEVSFTEGTEALTDFMVRPFPVMIFPPVDSSRMSGRLPIVYPLTSSSTNIYEDSVLTPHSPVVAIVDNGVIVRFEGDADEVLRIEAHFAVVGRYVNGNPLAVNSWHTGINPLSYFEGDADADVERWSNAVFGSPRFTHFHACGSEPGDIAISLFDATISFDGVDLWRDGRLVFLEAPQNRDLLDRFPDPGAVIAMRREIGMPHHVGLARG